MRVKELSLHGFKSFAGKHRFVFPAGITAVVGPNGSGKSNIADAVRWVLGEQRGTVLRAKRTDEIIFAGTQKRARAGLAEVNLVLDNESGRIDMPYAEVVVGRRAQRDGANTYLLNDAPVRLRDVSDLLGAQLGHGGYSVIGQGMVDSALTLRPEERRLLIDEAAGLVPLQRQRERSLARLAETDDNLTRVRDILEETGPRMRRMARLAERAARHDEVADELRRLLGLWYGHHWSRARRQRDREQDLVAELRAHVEAARDGTVALQALLSDHDASRAAARQRHEDARRRREALLADVGHARQAAAVARARLDGLASREAERHAAVVAEGAEEEAMLRRVAELEADLATLSRQEEERSEALRQAREALAAAEARRDDLARSVDAARASALQLRATASALRERMETVDADRLRRAEELAAAAAAAVEAQAAGEQLAAAAVAAREVQEQAARRRERAVAELQAVEARLTELDGELAAAREAHAAAAARLGAVQARSEALDALFGDGDESHQSMARIADAPGVEIVGAVARLLEVAPGWEAAVAAALGYWVHGVVLRGRSALAAALAVADPGTRGTLTLVPASDQDAVAQALGPHRPWSALEGELDCDAVARAPDAVGLPRALLGGTAFVPDLEAATAALARDGGPHRAATRDGLLLLPHGVVVMGTPAREVLAIEAERRHLPSRIDAARVDALEHASRVESLALVRRQAEGSLSELVSARRDLDRAHAEAVDRDEKARALAERAAREQQWREEERARLARAADALQAERNALATEAEAGEERLAEAERALRDAESLAEAAVVVQARDAVAAAGTLAGEASQAAAGCRAMLRSATTDLETTRLRLAATRDREAALADERLALSAETDQLSSVAARLASEVEAADAALQAAEDEARDANHTRAEAAAALEESARQVAGLETRLAEARVAEAHAMERLARLGEQLLTDMELMVPERLDGAPVPAASAPSGMGEAGRDTCGDADVEALASGLLHDVPALPGDVEGRIGQLRRELRAIGAIDREALATYRETEERHEHLTAQQDDLLAAQRDIMAVLDRLESEMSTRFDATFGAVAQAFASFFPRLFGGGEAELVLQRTDNAVGIEIVARPPGKRRQPLGLLSGGERSLTAVALVFALLQVSDTPFVVLDEVDAALDEANVARFRSALEALAEKTQVVIITHNRGTIQAADTVYGITMSDDGASQVVSLQVPRQ